MPRSAPWRPPRRRRSTLALVVEYALMGALIAVLLVAAVGLLGGHLDDFVNRLAGLF